MSTLRVTAIQDAKTSGVYLHCRPDYSVFYVGKGTKNRAKFFHNRNPHHTSVINKYGKENILIGYIECSSENIAFDLERGLIKCLANSQIKLTNQTNGGDGFTNGHTPWNKGTVGIMSAWNKGKKLSNEYCQKLSEAHKGQGLGKKRKPLSNEHKEKISKANSNKESWNKGIPMSDETKLKLRLAKKGKSLSEEHKKNISFGMKKKSK
jgi:hypothetical protein